MTKFMGQLNDYLGVFEKANKHLRNQEVTELLPKFELMKRTDFEGDGSGAPQARQAARRAAKDGQAL